MYPDHQPAYLRFLLATVRPAVVPSPPGIGPAQAPAIVMLAPSLISLCSNDCSVSVYSSNGRPLSQTAI